MSDDAAATRPRTGDGWDEYPGLIDMLDDGCKNDVKGLTEWRDCGPYITVTREACTRNIESDHPGLFVLTYDTVAEKPYKGSMIFKSMQAYFDLLTALPEERRNFYDRMSPSKPIPLLFDIDGVPCSMYPEVDDLLSDLYDRVRGFVEETASVDTFEVDAEDFAVFRCPKKDKDGMPVWSLHIHSTEYCFKTPGHHRMFIADFLAYCSARDLYNFGVDGGVYSHCRSMRLPYCSKAEKDQVRTLLRHDKQPSMEEDTKIALVKQQLQNEIRCTYAPEQAHQRTRRNRHGQTVADLVAWEPEGGGYDQKLMDRTQELLMYRLQKENVRCTSANMYRFIWETDGWYCDGCRRNHDTGFLTKVDNSTTPPQIVIRCFRKLAYVQHQPWSKVLGSVNKDPVSYTFNKAACMALIADSSTLRADLDTLHARKKAEEKTVSDALKALAKPTVTEAQKHAAEARIDASEAAAAEIEMKMVPMMAELQVAKEKVLTYVDKFWKLIEMRGGGGTVMRVRYEEDVAVSDNPKVTGLETMGTVKDFVGGYIKITYRTLTFDPACEKENIFMLWMDWDKRKLYTGTGYYPTGSPYITQNPDHFNVFCGLRYDYDPDYLATLAPGVPREDIPGLFFPATMRVLKDRTESGCDSGNNTQTAFFLYWVSCLLRCPGQPTPVMHIFSGVMGTGKSLITKLIKNLVGEINTKEVTGFSDLFHKFNAHLENCLYFVVSEVGALGPNNKNPDDKVEEALRDMLDSAGGKKNIVAKSKDATSANIVMWTIGTTNHRDCVEISPKGDERRKNPLDANRNITPQHFLVKMVDEIEDKRTLKTIFHWFYEMQPIGTTSGNRFFFDPANMPRTPYRKYLMNLQKGGSSHHEVFHSLFFEPILKYNGSADGSGSNSVELFGDALCTLPEGDGDSPGVLPEGDIKGPTEAERTIYFKQAAYTATGTHKPSHIRIPSKFFWLNVRTSPSQPCPKKALKELIGTCIDHQYVDWYNSLHVSQPYALGGGQQAGCFVIPYGPGGSELKKIAKAVLN